MSAFDPIQFPEITLRIDGEQVAPDGIVRAAVKRALSCPARANIILESQDFSPGLGTSLRLERTGRAGPPLFEGALTAVQVSRSDPGRRIVALRAEDALSSLRNRNTPGVHQACTTRALANALVGPLGLSVEAVDAPDPEAPLRIAARGSDYEFLTEESRRVGLYFHVVDGALRLQSLDTAPGEPRALDLSAAIAFRIAGDTAEAGEVLQATSWTPERITRSNAMAFGLEVSDVFGLSRAPGGSEGNLLGLAEASDDLIMARAAAEMARRDAGRVTLEATFDGAEAFELGGAVTVQGSDYAPAVPLIVTEIEERIDAASGHVVTISTRPPPQPPARPDRMTWGIVSDNADPDQLGRVKCTLPAFGDAETGWLQMLRPMAGDDGGLAATPSVDDHVLLLCSEGRPELSVVLGCLPGERRLHLDPGNNERIGLRTERGQAVALDDDAGSVEIETRSGTRLRMDPGGATLSADGDLTLEAPGGRITIRASRIDFEQE